MKKYIYLIFVLFHIGCSSANSTGATGTTIVTGAEDKISGIDLSPQIVRHYFQDANWKAVEEIKEGMTQDQARKSAGGIEYRSFETIRNGFTIALDEKRSAFITLDKAAPIKDQNIDFYCSKENGVVMVYYNKNKIVSSIYKQSN